jgi:hypothetical protein
MADQIENSEPLSTAYDALVFTVRQFRDEGRSTLAVTVNQRMRSPHGFDVTSSGFRSFKPFLESARDRGLVYSTLPRPAWPGTQIRTCISELPCHRRTSSGRSTL